MLEVILLYDSDCPNIADCRTNLIKAFDISGNKPSWREIDLSSDEAPSYFRGFGSPTILVNRSDVAGQEPSLNGASCRLYQTEDGTFVGIPSIDQITASLSSEGSQENVLSVDQNTCRSGWKETIAVIPAIGVVLLPNITCPACWPGYAAILSSFGIGFLPSNRYLPLLMATFLVFYLLVLTRDARKRHQFGPLIVGTMGSLVLVTGRFILVSNAVMYAGVFVLATASIWNAWPSIQSKWFARHKEPKACPNCQTAKQFEEMNLR